MPITVELGDIEADVRRAADAAGLDLSAFVREAAQEKIRKNNFAVARAFDGWTDAELLASVKSGFPVGFRARYRELRAKRDAGLLTDTECEELIRCSDRVLQRDTERLPLLMELARRQKTDVPALINRLHLRRQVA